MCCTLGVWKGAPENQHFCMPWEQEHSWHFTSVVSLCCSSYHKLIQALFKALTGKYWCWVNTEHCNEIKMCFPNGVNEGKSHLSSLRSPNDHQISPPVRKVLQAPHMKQAVPKPHSNGSSEAVVSEMLDFPQSESIFCALSFDFCLGGSLSCLCYCEKSLYVQYHSSP